MEQKVLKILEYNIIVKMLSECANSQMGKELAINLFPETDILKVKSLLEMTSQAETIYKRIGSNPVDRFKDVREQLKKSNATHFLGTSELLDIAKAAKSIRVCKESIAAQEVEGQIDNYAQSLIFCKDVENEIFRCILSEEDIADSASNELMQIRKKIKAANSKVREKLNNMMHSSSFSKYLQEPIVTMRSNRYVLPVKQEYRGQVTGIIHDQSASGSTLFIEPTSIVELGNEIKKLMLDEQKEIENILSALTALVAQNSQDMINSLLILAQLDLVFAKAKLAERFGAVCPEINSGKYINIIAGRHPLIDKSLVVPVDIWLGDEFKTLIITGPNTGGKTVTLKTVGLFCLMAQSGLFIPANVGSELPVFKGIFADIGDEQSIAQNLSTFSSHMKNIVSILKDAWDESLILLDELGSGTDPVEGAALAMAILSQLHSRGCITLATTHYSELKAFAMTTDSMQNASMEFDVNSLSPTYRLFIGIPGKSNAFEISRRLGLDQSIIDKAQENLNKKDADFEEVISSAQEQKSIAQQERNLAQQAREELFALRAQVEIQKQKLEQQKDRILQKAQQEAKAIIAKTKESSEQIIKELKETSKKATSSEVSRSIQQARDSIRNKEKSLQSKNENKQEVGEIPKTVQVGQTVFVTTLGQNVVVNSLPDNKGEVNVQAGIMKVNVKMKDLRVVKSQSKSNNAAKKVNVQISSTPKELDIRGLNAEEATFEVENYIDQVSRSSLNEVSIIHGKGSGILRSVIQLALKQSSQVKSFRLGSYGEGDAGVTIVTMK